MTEKKRRYKDLGGKKFGSLTVLENTYRILDGDHGQWKCRCDCGKELWVYVNGLTSGRATHCGCKNQIDIVGERYGILTVMELDHIHTNNNGTHEKVWKCKCDCGNIVYRTKSHLKSTSSCNCLKALHRVKSLKGKRFGKLTVINDAYEERKNRLKTTDLKIHHCKCDCGGETWVSTVSLNNGNTVSCGCYSTERIIKKNIELRGDKHPRWKGGKSEAHKGYCYKFSRISVKERVRSFWDNKCVQCGKTKDEEGKNLSVHHVYENKGAKCDTTPKLFVTLCSTCHGRYHHSHAKPEYKEYCLNLYLQAIQDRGGKCMYTEEEHFKMKHNVDINS